MKGESDEKNFARHGWVEFRSEFSCLSCRSLQRGLGSGSHCSQHPSFSPPPFIGRSTMLLKSHIQAKHAPQIVGVARDIIHEADAGYYDACAMGKKGMGWFDDIFLGSITSKLLEISENHPVWLVSGNEWKSRKVLVAMDHTPKAVQLARYVGEMLRGLEGVQIHFYHYCAPFAENLTQKEKEKMKEIERRMVERDKEEMDHFFDEAQKALEDLGYDKKALGTRFDYDKSASTKKVSPAILKEVRKGKYGTLVLGRKGSTQAREFRLGSVVLRTVTEVENCAVWVV